MLKYILLSEAGMFSVAEAKAKMFSDVLIPFCSQRIMFCGSFIGYWPGEQVKLKVLSAPAPALTFMSFWLAAPLKAGPDKRWVFICLGANCF